ncbi:MAG: hypothetical protein JNG90_19355 [Planctomycetaceae bacterium]|nr:hypothetical protein [Planctomycetaceae bacterium]
MEFLFQGISGILGLASLICWIMVLVRMFQAGDTVPAIASLVLVLCLIGPFIAFVYGWMNADRLRVRTVMYVWTALLVFNLLGGCAGILLPRQLGLA